MRTKTLWVIAVVLFVSCHVWSQERISIDDDGRISIDGVKRFPFGFYHVSWVNNRMGAEQRADLAQIADAGFDLIVPTLDPDANATQFLALAEQRDVLVIPEMYWPSIHITIPFLRDSPAILGFAAVDDFNYPPLSPPYTPEQVGERSAQIRQYALPDQLTYGSGSGYPCCELGDYAPYLQVIGPQVYPVGSDPNIYDLLWSLRSWTHVEAELPNTPVLAAIQTFRWPKKRFPSRIELRNLLYAALIHGVDGIAAYTFWDDGGLLPVKSPATWDEMKLLLAETRQMEPALLNYSRRVVTFPSQYFQAGVWESSSDGWVVVLNVHASQSLAVSVPLPGWTSAVPAFAGRTTTLTLSGSVLSGTVAKEQVQVFRLSR